MQHNDVAIFIAYIAFILLTYSLDMIEVILRRSCDYINSSVHISNNNATCGYTLDAGCRKSGIQRVMSRQVHLLIRVRAYFA